MSNVNPIVRDTAQSTQNEAINALQLLITDLPLIPRTITTIVVTARPKLLAYATNYVVFKRLLKLATHNK
jgi:hypothetical protein